MDAHERRALPEGWVLMKLTLPKNTFTLLDVHIVMQKRWLSALKDALDMIKILPSNPHFIIKDGSSH